MDKIRSGRANADLCVGPAVFGGALRAHRQYGDSAPTVNVRDQLPNWSQNIIWRVHASLATYFPYKRRPPTDGGDTEGAAARALAERMPLLVGAELTGLHGESG